MIRSLKVMGLALIAVLALTAIEVAAASAAEFESEATETFIHGEQETKNVLTVNSRTVECKVATFDGTQVGRTATTLEVHPVYEECMAFGLPATVTTTGCDYRLNQPGISAEGPTSGTMNVVCTSGDAITINVNEGTCSVTVGSQGGSTGLVGIGYTNSSSSPKTIDLSYSVTAVAANVSGSVLDCGTNGARAATYTGTALATGWTNESMTTPVGIAVSGTEEAEFESEATETFIHGEQGTKNILTVNSRTVECEVATFSGFQTGKTATTLRVHPVYEECTAFGLPATVTTAGCDYILDQPTTSMEGLTSGTVNVICESGKTITINVNGGTCLVTVGSQGGSFGLAGIGYTDGSGPPKTVNVSYNVTTIVANVSGNVLHCGTNGARTATYRGTALATGWTNAYMTTPVGIAVM
jgi:hypothetical protein